MLAQCCEEYFMSHEEFANAIGQLQATLNSLIGTVDKVDEKVEKLDGRFTKQLEGNGAKGIYERLADLEIINAFSSGKRKAYMAVAIAGVGFLGWLIGELIDIIF